MKRFVAKRFLAAFLENSTIQSQLLLSHAYIILLAVLSAPEIVITFRDRIQSLDETQDLVSHKFGHLLQSEISNLDTNLKAKKNGGRTASLLFLLLGKISANEIFAMPELRLESFLVHAVEQDM